MRRLFRFGLASYLTAMAFSGAGCAQTQLSPSTVSGPPQSPAQRSALVNGLRAAALPIRGQNKDYDALMTLVGDARFVLLGEATHGTHEFYRERARITRRLIQEKGFTAIAVEGDWPDAYRVNQWVRGLGSDANAEQALSNFGRFPRWMWRNTDVRDMLQWLRQHNAQRPAASRAGFYGLDLYSLPTSSTAIALHLERVDSLAAQRARTRMSCFARFRNDPDAYGLAAVSGSKGACETVAAEQFHELQQMMQQPAMQSSANTAQRNELFSAWQNARVVRNAEEYYRIMYGQGASSWNLRDRHMADTLEALAAHLGQPGQPAKVVVWAHNSHVGDARTTTMGQSGEWTLGQLMRERQAAHTVLVGFTTYSGTVIAAPQWGEAGRVERVRPALPGSFSALFHETGVGNFLLPLRGQSEVVLAMGEPRLERAIGVVYLPQTERESHYFQARMSKQFDAVIHMDTTTALKPLP
ncbi:MAG: hypothetical protein JWN98_1626 [Abditibacteriota bacterium]|nr:hypothetical protein [Abditibacteriota bacterium]